VVSLEKESSALQVELFRLLAEFFGRAFHELPSDFATIETFADQVRKVGPMSSDRLVDAFRFADTELRQFYAEKGPAMFKLASRLGGLKLVLGGSSRFSRGQLGAVAGSLLYSDMALIPDPVAPWLETDRRSEKFRDVLMLQAAHALLHLKPIVDAELPHCPVFVFPSMEKMLEENDPITVAGIYQLVADVLAQHVNRAISSFDDAAEFVKKHPDQFLRAVEDHKLLAAPGGAVGEPLSNALTNYEKQNETWRTQEWINEYNELSISGKVLNALIESITPQFHVLENSEQLHAHPLICITRQAHYYRIVSSVNADRMQRMGLLGDKTRAIVSAFGSDRLTWISDVPLDSLVELRRNNENENFRKSLRDAVTDLHDAEIEDTDRVAGEICREIDSAIADHNRRMRDTARKNAQANVKWLGSAFVSGLAALVPTLSPYLGAAVPLALASKASWDIYCQRVERRQQSRSLMGVLATVRNPDD
jgi:hypothetical protein